MSLSSCADENEINKSAVEIVLAGRTEIIHIILQKKKNRYFHNFDLVNSIYFTYHIHIP